MPGGQYTNLMFQSQQLGLSGRWPAIKKAYAKAAETDASSACCNVFSGKHRDCSTCAGWHRLSALLLAQQPTTQQSIQRQLWVHHGGCGTAYNHNVLRVGPSLFQYSPHNMYGATIELAVSCN